MRMSPLGFIIGTKGVPQSGLSIDSKTSISISFLICFSICAFHANGNGRGLQNIGLKLSTNGSEIVLIVH